MSAQLTRNDPYQRLLGAVDQLAVVQADYLADRATHRQLRAATDAVAAARDAAGVELRLIQLAAE